MPKVDNFFSARVLELMKQIEIEKDRETLEQLFKELNLVLNQSDQELQHREKRARGTGPGQEKRRA